MIQDNSRDRQETCADRKRASRNRTKNIQNRKRCAENKCPRNKQQYIENESCLKRKQFRLLAAVVLMMLWITSCGKDTPPSGNGGQIWIPEFLPLEIGEDSYPNIAFAGDTLYYISYQQQAEGFRYRLSSYSPTQGSLPDLALSWPEGGDRFVTSLFAMDEESAFYLISYVTEEDGSRTHLCKFDAKGSLVYDTDITGEAEDLNLLAVDGRGRVYLSGRSSGSPSILLYTAEGAYRGTVIPDLPNGGISALGRDQSGAMYAACHSDSGGGTGYFLSEIDFDRGKLGASLPDFPRGDNSLLIPGMEDTLLSYDRTSVYAYDLAARTGETLFDWLDYGINGSHVTALHVREDGSLQAVIRNFSGGSTELALLRKAEGSQAPQRETIVLGTLYSNSILRNAAMKFNRENDKYQLKIREYMDPQTHDRAEAALRMNSDILSDDCPDILDIADLDLKALASKGLFADLNTCLESSALLSRGDFPDSLLDAYTIEGNLITIPSRFSLKTVFGWSAQVGDTFGWTLEEMMAYADANPDAEVFDNVSRSEVMRYLMSYNEDAFIDWSTGECRFESDAFKALLEFASRFPGETRQNAEQSSTPVRIQNGEVLLLVEDIAEFDSIQLPLEIYHNEGTCIGFPASDGSAGCMLIPYGAYAITVKSDLKEGAWAFIESLLASQDAEASFFPSKKDTLAEKAADAVTPEYLTDEAGEILLGENGEPIPKESGMAIAYSDWEYTYHIPTREEADLILRLIEAAKPVSFSEANEVVKIINEEAEGYYLGQKTAEEVMEIIQNRVRIYVNEK